jgi:hypothetical protein
MGAHPFLITTGRLPHRFRANTQGHKLDVVSNREKWGQPQL